MRLVARFIATMAVAFVMVPALHADETPKPGGKATRNKVAASSIAPATIATPKPSAAKELPAPSAASRVPQGPRSQPGSSPTAGIGRTLYAEGRVVLGIFLLACHAH